MALVNYERDGHVVTLTLNRPEKLNAFNDELVGALSDELHRFDTDEEAHIAILCGNGRAFSSGADVHQRQLRSREEFLKLGGPQGRGTHSSDLLTRSVNWKPVIASAHGYVLGNLWGEPHDARACIAHLKAHRLKREAKILGVMQQHPEGSMDDWVQLAYDDVPPRLWPVAMRSLLAHVERIRMLAM